MEAGDARPYKLAGAISVAARFVLLAAPGDGLLEKLAASHLLVGISDK